MTCRIPSVKASAELSFKKIPSPPCRIHSAASSLLRPEVTIRTFARNPAAFASAIKSKLDCCPSPESRRTRSISVAEMISRASRAVPQSATTSKSGCSLSRRETLCRKRASWSTIRMCTVGVVLFIYAATLRSIFHNKKPYLANPPLPGKEFFQREPKPSMRKLVTSVKLSFGHCRLSFDPMIIF